MSDIITCPKRCSPCPRETVIMSGNFHVIDRTLRSLGCNRAFSSQIFDRKLKARQKLWALQQQDCFLAAGGLRKDMENRLFEKVKVCTWNAGIVLNAGTAIVIRI